MSTYQPLQAKRAEIVQPAFHYGAYNVRIFGSVARREAHSESDIDFLIVNGTWAKFARLRRAADGVAGIAWLQH